jgi:uncharacterized protein
VKTIQVSDATHAQLVERKLASGASTLEAVISSALGSTGRRARLQQLAPAVSILCHARKVSRLRIFGSAAVGKDGPDSDLDLIVDFEPGARPGLSGLYGFGDDLQNLLGTKVDVSTENGLHRMIRDRVVKEAEVVWTA